MPLFFKGKFMIITNGETSVSKSELLNEKMKLERLYIDLSKRVKILEDIVKNDTVKNDIVKNDIVKNVKSRKK